ncbi:MAG: hypothetical protein IPI67_24145 [Myxococcales bacterium]|nr:hypothetical protein [Myxococcales bacterium]
MKRIAVCCVLLLTACGSGDGDDSGSTQSLSAPVMEMVMPMAPAGLHVTWNNIQPDCDEIEGERKSPSSEFAVVFAVPGSVDNKHDGTATEKVEYFYRVRCRKGETFSAYSDLMAGTP